MHNTADTSKTPVLGAEDLPSEEPKAEYHYYRRVDITRSKATGETILAICGDPNVIEESKQVAPVGPSPDRHVCLSCEWIYDQMGR